MQTSHSRTTLFSISLLFLLLVFCVLFADEIHTEMQTATERCLCVIIPSLYAMMILSQMLITTNAWRVLAMPLRRITPRLFGLPDSYFALFLLSQFAGYPVGAGMIRTLSERGSLQRDDAKRLFCVCYGSGPAFLLGILGTHPNRSRLFLLIFGAVFLSNLLLTRLLFRKHPVQPVQADTAAKQLSSADSSLLVRCTAESGRTLLKLCGIILCFSAVCAILRCLGLFQLFNLWAKQLSIPFSVTTIVESLLEISNVVQLSLPITLQLPLLAGLLSFGGFCVILQIRAIAGSAISMRLFVSVRLLSAALSAIFCYVGMRLFSWDSPLTAVSVSALPVRFHKSTSFPVCMLLIMMMLVFREEHQLRKHTTRSTQTG